MKKKLLGVVLAATMLLGTSMTVSATTISGDDVGKDKTVDFLSAVSEVVIQVTVSKGGENVIVNPYGLNVADAADDVSTDSLIIPDISFNNLSNTPVSLSLRGRVTVSDGSAVTFATSIPTSKPKPTTYRQALVYVDVVSGNDKTAKVLKPGTDTEFTPTILDNKSNKALANSPILSLSMNNPEKTSPTATLKFKGWTVAKDGETWPKSAGLKVTITYNLSGSGLGSESKFKTSTTTG